MESVKQRERQQLKAVKGFLVTKYVGIRYGSKGLLIETDLAIIAIVGKGMRGNADIAGRVFGVLGDHNSNAVAITQGSSEFNIPFLVRGQDELAGVRILHRVLFENQ